MKESAFQAQVISAIRAMFDGCFILKNDANYIQGFPDLLILYDDWWAALEVKRSGDAPLQPNQRWYIDKLMHMSYAAVICPENMEDVLYELQHAYQFRR